MAATKKSDGAAKREKPKKPVTPVTPVTPEKPVTPDKPEKPVTPETPENPVTPETPEKPVTPATPEKDSDRADIDWLTRPVRRLMLRLAPGDAADPSRAGSGEGAPGNVRRGLDVLSERRYLVLSGVIVLAIAVHLGKGRWPGAVDIWEHAAAVRELARHPFSPGHPLLAVDAPHQFFSPYLLAVGLFSRITRLSAITSLNIAAIGNLVLFLVGLRLYVGKVVNRQHADFYALLFTLFLWGPGAWFFSGFLHFDVLGLVASYPSTFVKGVVLLALWGHLNYLERDDPPVRPLVLIGLASATVILTHPVDAVFLAVGLAAQAAATPLPERRRHLLTAAAVVGLSFVVATMWPYFSVRDLLFSPSVEPFRQAGAGGDRDMYIHVLPRMALTLLVVPFVIRRLRGLRSDALVLMFLGCAAAYWYGFLSEHWQFGRLISSIQFVAAVILAEERTAAGEAAQRLGDAARPMLRWVQVTTAMVVLAGVFYLRNGFEILPQRWTDDIPYKWLHAYVDMVPISAFDYLDRNHSRYPVVMADLYTSLEVPVFGSKAVGVARAQAFVDGSQRGADVNRFFGDNVPLDERKQILDKYQVSLLMLPAPGVKNEAAKYRPFLELGRVVSENDRFVFVDVRRA